MEKNGSCSAAFCESAALRARLLPLGGAVAQRLRGYGWRSEKSVKAIAPTGAALAFCASTSALGLSRASSPWPVAGWVESRGREGGVGTPLPAFGPAERFCTLKVGRKLSRQQRCKCWLPQPVRRGDLFKIVFLRAATFHNIKLQPICNLVLQLGSISCIIFPARKCKLIANY